MKTPVKIRYERQTGKGAATFIGFVYFDDGSKTRIADIKTMEGMPDLPIEHDGLPEPIERALVSFPKVPGRSPLPISERPRRNPAPLWPLFPKK